MPLMPSARSCLRIEVPTSSQLQKHKFAVLQKENISKILKNPLKCEFRP